MVGSSYTTLSDVIETFDIEETRRLLDAQLESLHDDACEGMIDNFKVLYQRYLMDLHHLYYKHLVLQKNTNLYYYQQNYD